MNGKSRRGKKSSFSLWKLMHGGDKDGIVSRPIAWVSPSSLSAEQSHAQISPNHPLSPWSLACLGGREAAATGMRLVALLAVMAWGYPWRS